MKNHPLYTLSSLLLSGSVFLYTISLILGSAQALPQGPSVSTASNPLFTFGGTVSNGEYTGPNCTQRSVNVVTDVILTMNSNSCASNVAFTDSTGALLSQFKLHSYNHLVATVLHNHKHLQFSMPSIAASLSGQAPR